MLTKHLKHLETHDPASPMEMLIVVSSMMVFNVKAYLKFQEAGVFYSIAFLFTLSTLVVPWYHFRNNLHAESWGETSSSHRPITPSGSTRGAPRGIFGLSHKQLLGSEWVENDSLTVKFELEVRPDDWHLGSEKNFWPGVMDLWIWADCSTKISTLD